MSALVLYTPSGGDGATILWPSEGPPDQRWNFAAGQLIPIAGLIGYGDGSITFEDGRSFPQRTPQGSTFYHVPLEQTPYPRPVQVPPPVTPPVTPPITPPVVNPPVVNNATFSLDTGATLAAGQVVGTMTASNAPTAWVITGATIAGNFSIAIDFSIDTQKGVIKLTASGVDDLAHQTGTEILTVQATNAGGSGAGTATINYQPATQTVPPAAPTGLVLTPM
jgi:hypothetical protein